MSLLSRKPSEHAKPTEWLKRVTSCPHLDLNDATETVKLVTEAGVQAIAVRGDTSDEAAVDDLKRRAKEDCRPAATRRPSRRRSRRHQRLQSSR